MADRQRWIEICLAPAEALETELKGWLDLGSNEDKANVAQGILALANHGGGAVLIGFEENANSWRELSSAPPALASFTTDAVNGIVEKYADPSFHCELHVIEHDKLQHPHPVIVVPGGHRVPIRARRGGPSERHVQKDAYYIRRPGPQSAPPQTAAEWQQLIHRCVMTDRDALLDNLRAALAGESSRGAPESLQDRAAAWEADCLERFKQVVAEKNATATYGRGYWSCAYSFEEVPDADTNRLMNELRAVEHQTGWPVWIMFDREPIKPYPLDGLIECHVYESDASREPAHSDFWRAAPDGRFFLVRGYQEDEPENLKNKNVSPGKALDRNLPLWRIGECLLHATRMAQRLGVPNTAIQVRATWTGLAGRSLQDVFEPWDWSEDVAGPSKQSVVRSTVTVDADRLRLQLVDLVIQITKPLFEAFDFEVIERPRVEHAMKKMLQRTGGA